MRTVVDHPVRCLWSSFENEVNSDPSINALLDANPSDRGEHVLDLPVYQDHPSVVAAKAAGTRLPIPVGVYVDGVSYSCQAAGRQESVVGVWCINLCTKRRHFFAAIKSGDYCGCGCRGACTVFPVMDCLRYQLESMQHGAVPLARHDGSEWQIHNPKKTFKPKYCTQMAPGSSLSYSTVVCYIKGDWAEISHSPGMVSWKSLYSPCLYCHLSQGELFEHDDTIADEDGPHWPLKTHQDYNVMCAKCEVHVTLTTSVERKSMCAVLRWRRDKTKIGGRVVFKSCTVAGVTLEEGGRLEPSTSLLDIASLERARLPITIVLWRPRLSYDNRAILDGVNHRSPIFSVALHTSPARNLCVDTLHTLWLGPVLRFCQAAIWRILLRNCYGVVGSLVTKMEVGIVRLRASMSAYFETHGVPHNRRLANMTVKMIGKANGFGPKDAQCPFVL